MCNVIPEFDEDDPIYDRFGEDWDVIDPPVDATLTAVVATDHGVVACGERGTLVRRDDDGEWETLVDAGPRTKRNPLTDIDVTDDGSRVWFVGGSGALGAYDVDVERKYDYSAPKEKTSTWEAVAVAGDRCAESILAANGSGEVLPAFTDDHGCPVWGEVTEPGPGSTIPALDIDDVGRGYAVDTSGGAFQKVDEDGWSRIGIEAAQVDFSDLLATESHAYVSGDEGRIYRYDRPCDNWTPNQIGQQPVAGVDARAGVVVAAAAEGSVYERHPTEGWRETDTDTGDDFTDVAVGAAVDVAVGEGGVVAERN